MYSHHSNLDDVGGRPLKRRIDCVSFGEIAHGGASRIYIREVASAAENGLDISAFACLLDGALDKGVYARIGAQVSIYEILGFAAWYAQTFAQPEGADAVDYAEIGGLGFASLVIGDGVFAFVKYFGGSGAVDVFAFAEGFEHYAVAAERCHKPQLDLRVVAGHNFVALGRAYESSAYTASLGGAYGDVLQVGVVGRKASRGRGGLVEGGMYHSIRR